MFTEVRQSNEGLKTEIVKEEGCESSLIEEDEEDWIQIESNGLEKETMIIEFPSPNLAVITNRKGSDKFNINEQMEKLKLVEVYFSKFWDIFFTVTKLCECQLTDLTK